MSEKGGSDLDVFKTVSKPPAAPKKTLLGMQVPRGLADGLPPLPPPPSSQATQRGLPPPPPPSRRPPPPPTGAESTQPPVPTPPVSPDLNEVSDEEPTPLFPAAESSAVRSAPESNENVPDFDDEDLATEVFSTESVAAAASRISSGLGESRKTKPGQPAPPFNPPLPPPPSGVPLSARVSAPPPKPPVSPPPAVPSARRTEPGELPPPSRPPGMLTIPRGMKSIPPAVAPPPPSVSAPKSLPPPPPPPGPAAPSGEGWDDDDKTEVYSRSAGQDAVRRLLGTTTPRTSAIPDVPPPPMSRPTAPVPTPPLVAARRAAIVAEQHSLEPKSVPPAPSQNRTPLILAAVAICALAAALFFILSPSTGALVVTVAGPGNRPIDGVQVLVNDQVVCEGSTCHLDLPAGTHYVQARAAGYQDFAKTAVHITSGGDAVRNIQLLPASGTGIRVKAEGTGLKLSVDGREVGPLPQELKELSPGEHQVKVAGEHFETWEQKVEVKADEMQTIGPLKLKVLKGLAMIKDGGNADGARIVLQSGADRRILPSLPINLHIDTTKPHTLIASKSGFETFRQELEFEDGQAERTFEISLERSPETATEPERSSARRSRAPRPSAPARNEAASGRATLNFNTIPASKIILDGKPLGDTPKVGVSVGAGRHSVTFLSDGKRVSKSVNVGAGESKTVTHRF